MLCSHRVFMFDSDVCRFSLHLPFLQKLAIIFVSITDTSSLSMQQMMFNLAPSKSLAMSRHVHTPGAESYCAVVNVKLGKSLKIVRW